MTNENPNPYRPLFERVSDLAGRVPWVGLADLPTPLDQVDDHLWIKRDDLTSARYGGNKVRKLEFLLAQAAARGGPVITAGATGSHFAVATAIHAATLGIDVEVVRFPQPMSPHVAAMAERFTQSGARAVEVSRPEWFPAVQAWRRLRRRREHPLLVPTGGSSPVGVLGYVNAALELVEQHHQLDLREPDEIVTAMSSCGTAVGLQVGFRLAGWSSVTVVGVRVADRVVTNGAWIGQLRHRTTRLIGESWFGRAPLPPLVVDSSQFGRGYGEPTGAGDAATAHAAVHWKLDLEPTYTAKAVAAVLARRRPDRRQIYIHTFAG